MNEKHYKEKLSAYLNHELPKEERQAIAEHLLQCEDCRGEHDEIMLGAAFANRLESANAPNSVWNNIEASLEGKAGKEVSTVPYFSLFNSRGLAAAAAVLIVGIGLIAAIYFGLLKDKSGEIAENPSTNQTANVEKIPQITPPPSEVSTNQNTNTQAPSNEQILPGTNSNLETLPKPVRPPVAPNETLSAQNDPPSWNVETLAGAPKIGNSFESGKLAVGQFLETDANSRARLQVANIGQVEIEPNSRVQLVKTASTEHRLSLKKGILQAKILAPPRLFIVDTPSAVAIDLGCEYTLEVDKDGNSKLHVTSGYVALERDGREAIVPAGSICFTRRGKGLGTPFSEDASETFQKALVSFDFENGGSNALLTIFKEANYYDTLSLWHLLPRTRGTDREKVFDALSKYVKPPAGTTREGILRLDKKMLDQWWTEIENLWFE
jgi:hypothetical protein